MTPVIEEQTMEKDRINRWLTLGANFGVIAGILLLVYELRQNNELMGAEARYNRLIVNTENYGRMADNPELAELWLKAIDNEELSRLEQTRIDAFLVHAFLVREWSYKELPETELPIERWRRNHRQVERYNIVWEREKSNFVPGFVQFMDANVVKE
jgi:hypothetical protein